MRAAIMTLARWHARKIIKTELYEQGIKLLDVESREITMAANRYIDDHPEIMTLACESYRKLVATGRLRPPQAEESCAALLRFAQRVKR